MNLRERLNEQANKAALDKAIKQIEESANKGNKYIFIDISNDVLDFVKNYLEQNELFVKRVKDATTSPKLYVSWRDSEIESKGGD